jgi:hypothetical protein
LLRMSSRTASIAVPGAADHAESEFLALQVLTCDGNSASTVGGNRMFATWSLSVGFTNVGTAYSVWGPMAVWRLGLEVALGYGKEQVLVAFWKGGSFP